MILRFAINLLDDGSVVTKDGEYLGTWESDENDHPEFTPVGASEVLFFGSSIFSLCQRIEEWHRDLDPSLPRKTDIQFFGS